MERWIDDEAELARALAGVGGGALAVDTEADSLHHYEAKLCLIQLSFGRGDLLVDPLAGGGLDLASLAACLADPALPKIMHGADYDLRLLGQHQGLQVRGLFDTMIAARLTGERAFGLAALVERHLGIKLDKRFQTADWSRRPLAPELRAYAARDTRHLIELAACLERRLVELGRLAWAAEEFARLETQERPAPDPAARKAPHERVKGAAALGRHELCVLRALAELREEAARALDRPPFRIARDEVLLGLAREAARGGETHGAGASGWHPRVAPRVPAAIAAALAVDPAAWPARIEAGRRPPPDPRLEARVRPVLAERDRLAAGMGLDPTLIASRGQIERVVSGETGAERALRRWQTELLGPILARAGS